MPTPESPKTEHSPANTNRAASPQLSYAMRQFLQEHDQRRAFFAEGNSSKGDESQKRSEQTELAKRKGNGDKAQTQGKCPLSHDSCILPKT
ncbi:hypothetical protein JMJ35_010122 [Cladonia borealis]|uniref:Uncharacterized protein n=1 Tax=Cladonia borealis TaxID=184061 RepID=A0AA39V1P3_9LECA|nr:hypothetical protein JMJ35_010122 [Cladonia borealis]